MGSPQRRAQIPRRTTMPATKTHHASAAHSYATTRAMAKRVRFDAETGPAKSRNGAGEQSRQDAGYRGRAWSEQGAGRPRSASTSSEGAVRAQERWGARARGSASGGMGASTMESARRRRASRKRGASRELDAAAMAEQRKLWLGGVRHGRAEAGDAQGAGRVLEQGDGRRAAERPAPADRCCGSTPGRPRTPSRCGRAGLRNAAMESRRGKEGARDWAHG
jgi:hypothetical protein